MQRLYSYLSILISGFKYIVFLFFLKTVAVVNLNYIIIVYYVHKKNHHKSLSISLWSFMKWFLIYTLEVKKLSRLYLFHNIPVLFFKMLVILYNIYEKMVTVLVICRLLHSNCFPISRCHLMKKRGAAVRSFPDFSLASLFFPLFYFTWIPNAKNGDFFCCVAPFCVYL